MAEAQIPHGYKQTEVGVIPEDWESTIVRKIASPIRNAIAGGPFGSDLVSADYVEDGVPVIRGQNMGTKYVSGNFTDMDAEIAALEEKFAKARQLKQGMMQELLTGKTRLVDSGKWKMESEK